MSRKIFSRYYRLTLYFVFLVLNFFAKFSYFLFRIFSRIFVKQAKKIFDIERNTKKCENVRETIITFRCKPSAIIRAIEKQYI